MTHNQMIEVIAAHRDKKTIQLLRSNGQWDDLACPVWDFANFKYRIKPEPREWWAVKYGDGSVICEPSKQDAVRAADGSPSREVIRVREVLE